MKRIDLGYVTNLDFFIGWLSADETFYPFMSIHLLIGCFQPIVSIITGVQNSFKPYKSWYDVFKDVLQPLRGFFNIFKGIMVVGFSILSVPILIILSLLVSLIKNFDVFKEFNFFDKKLKDTEVGDLLFINMFWILFSISSLISGALKIFRGVTQILATPLGWISILMRGFLTYFIGWQDIFKNESIQDLVRCGRAIIKNNLVDDDDFYNSLYIVYKLHHKFHKALDHGQKTINMQMLSKEEEVYKEKENLKNKELKLLPYKSINQINEAILANYYNFFTEPNYRQDDNTSNNSYHI